MLSVAYKPIMHSVVMLNVVMLSVVAPARKHNVLDSVKLLSYMKSYSWHKIFAGDKHSSLLCRCTNDEEKVEQYSQ
jgi:hypothetical protein